jgi:hypothetical protein
MACRTMEVCKAPPLPVYRRSKFLREAVRIGETTALIYFFIIGATMNKNTKTQPMRIIGAGLVICLRVDT